MASRRPAAREHLCGLSLAPPCRCRADSASREHGVIGRRFMSAVREAEVGSALHRASGPSATGASSPRIGEPEVLAPGLRLVRFPSAWQGKLLDGEGKERAEPGCRAAARSLARFSSPGAVAAAPEGGRKPSAGERVASLLAVASAVRAAPVRLERASSRPPRRAGHLGSVASERFSPRGVRAV